MKATTSRRTPNLVRTSQRSLDLADQHILAFLERESEITREPWNLRNAIAVSQCRHPQRAIELGIVDSRLERADLVRQLVNLIQVVQPVDLYSQHFAGLRIKLDDPRGQRHLSSIRLGRKAIPFLALPLRRNLFEVVVLYLL